MRPTYTSDPSDAEWGCLEPHLSAPKATWRPRVYPLREIVNANFYVVRSGCSWRLLPTEWAGERAKEGVSLEGQKLVVLFRLI
jgi:transposase